MPDINETLEELLGRNLRHVLRANYIDVGDGRLCQEFLGILKEFIRKSALGYRKDVKEMLRLPDRRWNKQDLVSWIVSEVAALQSITLSRLYFAVCESEGLAPGQQRVDCGSAHGHSFLLSQLYEDAQRQWKQDRNTEPLSPKAQKKRRGRTWAPWLVDLVFK